MRTQEAFTISILDCAYKLNLRFNRTWTNAEGQTEYVFHSPTREDKNASIYINPKKNVVYDNGGIVDGGGIIWFINYIHGHTDLKDTRNALQVLDRIYPELKKPSKNRTKKENLANIKKTLPLFDDLQESIKKFDPPGHYAIKEENSSLIHFEITGVKYLYSYPLKKYLREKRNLNLNICTQYIKEVTYRHIEKNIIFYGIGFKSGDTWVIRRNGFKGFLGKGADISIFEQDSSRVLIFEGFIDFLSYLTIKKSLKPLHTVIVLNSAIFIGRAIRYINSKQHINKIDYFRDNDEAGLKSLKKLEISLNNAIVCDKSNVYPNHKDMNEWLINEYTRT